MTLRTHRSWPCPWVQQELGITVALELFEERLDQRVDVEQLQWRPPARFATLPQRALANRAVLEYGGSLLRCHVTVGTGENVAGTLFVVGIRAHDIGLLQMKIRLVGAVENGSKCPWEQFTGGRNGGGCAPTEIVCIRNQLDDPILGLASETVRVEQLVGLLQ